MAHTIYKSSNKKRLPSVTTIIGKNLGWNKEVLLKWYAKEFRNGRDPEQQKEKAANIGTLAHLYISCYIKSVDIPEEEKSKYPIEAILLAEQNLETFINALKENEIEIKKENSEIPLISEEHLFGGTIDFVFTQRGIQGLGDIKTSSNIYSDHIIQLGGYDILVKENNICIPQQYLFVHLNKDFLEKKENLLSLIWVPQEILDIGRETFLDLRKLHERQNVFNNYFKTKNKQKDEENATEN